jgi:hypothetical protein
MTPGARKCKPWPMGGKRCSDQTSRAMTFFTFKGSIPGSPIWMESRPATREANQTLGISRILRSCSPICLRTSSTAPQQAVKAPSTLGTSSCGSSSKRLPRSPGDSEKRPPYEARRQFAAFSTYRTYVNQAVANALALPYLPGTLRMPFRRLFVERAAHVRDELVTLALANRNLPSCSLHHRSSCLLHRGGAAGRGHSRRRVG